MTGTNNSGGPANQAYRPIIIKALQKNKVAIDVILTFQNGMSFEGEISVSADNVTVSSYAYQNTFVDHDSSNVQISDYTMLPAGAVYHEDDRREVHMISSPNKSEIASAVAGMVHISNLQFDTPTMDQVTITGQILSDKILEDFGLPACGNVKFWDQTTSAAQGTAFLVAQDMVATAGHCVDNINLDDWRFVFNYNKHSDHSGQVTVDKRFVVEADRIVERGSGGNDYALVKLKTTPPGVYSLSLNLSGQVNVDDGLFTVGHPMGLPKKIADGGRVREASDSHVFECDLDTFGGNSGSPVLLESTREVVGILVRGAADFVESNGCMTEATYSDPSEGGEYCTRIKFIIDALRSPDLYV